ncbi:hypothetical protein DPSP01_003695 [Paraphaeosphaeria sporulosa]
MAAAKRKASKNKTAKTPRVRKARSSTAPRKKATPGNANTPIQDHPYAHLPFSVRRDLDATNYGFKKIKAPTALPSLYVRRSPRKIPDPHPAIVPHLMQLMQNKLFLVREYFLPEVKALMWEGKDRGPRTASEAALLDVVAKGTVRGGAGLAVSYRAQDCVRLVLCYAALFAKEDENMKDGEEGVTVEERKADLQYRGIVWGWLKEEIGAQLPGDRKVREERAEEVLKKVFRLASEEEGGEVVGVGKEGGRDGGA